jgi:hypothetical protein
MYIGPKRGNHPCELWGNFEAESRVRDILGFGIHWELSITSLQLLVDLIA